MTSLPASSSTARSSPARRRAGRVIGGLLTCSVLMAQGAVTNGSGADTAPSAMGSSTRALDKALNGDLSTGDRNLDLLLESQRKGNDRLDEAPKAQPMPARPASGRQPLQPLPESASVAPTPRPPEAGQRFESLLALPERGQMANPSLPATKAARDWGGGTGQAAVGSSSHGGSIYGDTSGLRSAARPLREWIQEGVAFVKDNLLVIVLAGAVVVLLAKGLKAYSRRI